MCLLSADESKLSGKAFNSFSLDTMQSAFMSSIRKSAAVTGPKEISLGPTEKVQMSSRIETSPTWIQALQVFELVAISFAVLQRSSRLSSFLPERTHGVSARTIFCFTEPSKGGST